MKLLDPSLDLLPGYLDALERGWSPDNVRGEQASAEEIAAIRRDPAAFVALQSDREARGPPVALPDGSLVPRLPGYKLWMWDAEGFCGSIGFRWQPGTPRLPAHVLGHIGYAVAPWKRRRGYATAALAAMRARVRAEGLPYADLTCDIGNEVSARVIAANGGVAIERFVKVPAHGGKPALRFRWYAGPPFPLERETPRLVLRQWRDADRAALAALNADARVMEHYPAALARDESDALLERMRADIALRGWGNWALERKADGALLGFTGLRPVREDLAFAPAIEVGWRLARHAWGEGYATEAAREALRVAFEVLELPEVVSYTAATNARSAAVMRRLGMVADASFGHPALPHGHRLRPHRLFILRPGS